MACVQGRLVATPGRGSWPFLEGNSIWGVCLACSNPPPPLPFLSRSDINTFKYGVADRGSSIRIPLPVMLKGYGYLEDRRPAANVDPYTVARLLIKTTMH